MLSVTFNIIFSGSGSFRQSYQPFPSKKYAKWRWDQFPYIQPSCHKIHRSERCRSICLWQIVSNLCLPQSCQYQQDHSLLWDDILASNFFLKFFLYPPKNLNSTQWLQASYCLLHCKPQSNQHDTQLCPQIALPVMDPPNPLQIPVASKCSSAAHSSVLLDALHHQFIRTGVMTGDWTPPPGLVPFPSSSDNFCMRFPTGRVNCFHYRSAHSDLFKREVSIILNFLFRLLLVLIQLITISY